MAQRTLFNYFTKSPIASSPSSVKDATKTPDTKNQLVKTPKLGSESVKTPKTNSKLKRTSGFKTPQNSANGVKKEDCETPTTGKKAVPRKRIIVPEDDFELEDSPSKKPEGYLLDSEDSGDEYVPDDNQSDDDDEVSEHSESESATHSEEESPVKAKKRKRGDNKQNKPNKRVLLSSFSSTSSKTPTREPMKPASTPSNSENHSSGGGGDGEGKTWTFQNFEFLKPEKIRDAKKRRPLDPNYDPRTLYVPEDFLKGLTPAMRQWWEMKAKNYDCILFFKVGKFYEFYHMDAVTGVKELSLTFMRGEYAHCGFPEIAYGRFSANLVDKGYKVARVEQTETPDGMNERVKQMVRPTKFDKVVNREICQVTTKGTRIFTVVDGESREAHGQYLLAINEKENDSVSSTYGVCFVDTSIGTFHIGQFKDDRHSSRLRTMIALYPPVQVLYERNRISKRTKQILDTSLSGAVKEALAPESEFWSSTATLTKLAERKYFGDDGLPEVLKKFVGDSDSLGLTADEESEFGVRSLGAVIWMLTRCLLDYQLVSLAQFEIYKPIDIDLSSDSCKVQDITSRHMILDAVTLRNLNLIDNGCGGLQGTLLHQIDHCSTPFGKRLLRHWLCNPLTSIKSIKARQTALSVLLENVSIVSDATSMLSKVPDLERLLSRIYAQSSKGLEASHPDNRAVMFEERIYSKRKIAEFISVLNGFQTLQDVVKLFQESDNIARESEILSDCTNFSSSDPSGSFPDLTGHLNFFKNAFDHEEAEKEGRIVPSAGVDPEYDSALEMLSEVEKDGKAYLREQCEYFGCKVTFTGADKKRFQLEVPEGAARKANDGYELQGQRKGFKKYWTVETKELLERQFAAEEQKNNALVNLRKRIFSRFSDKIEDWTKALNCIAVLDVLMSLAKYCQSIESNICTPQFYEPSKWSKPYVNIKDGKFPCSSGDFIPNDTEIGGEGPSILLLTGPNMGGKSTLMRQLGLLTILAQMGSMVPASAMELSVVDRIFTRIGAQDDIMAGDSTFYLELCETSAVLSHASKHSLVLIDELGRGTSTYDGTAIAAAVLKELCRMQSRVIFSTHYHTLVDSFKDDPNIGLVHMACMAENEDEEEGSEENVTFLYKVASGGCPKSYGFNAARLAGVPRHITRNGAKRAHELEEEVIRRKMFRALFTSENPADVIRQLK